MLEIEQFLNGDGFKARFPDTGQDVKVFGVREDDRLAATIAMPLFCADIASESRYFARKDEVLAALASHFGDAPLAIEWRLNNLDARGRGAELESKGVRAQIDVRRGSPLGNPVEAILACARDNAADLIAMTTRGKGGLTDVVLGPVARAVLHSAPIPVFLFRYVDRPPAR